jgi:hypothetical protein
MEIGINLLTQEEKQVLDLIKSGLPIVGKEETNKACEIWINTCINNRVLSN